MTLQVLDLRGSDQRPERRRMEPDPSVRDSVARIVARVRHEGDEALFDLTLRFDGADLRERGLVAGDDELRGADEETPSDVRDAIDAMIERLRDLHARQLPPPWEAERGGVRYGEVVRPVDVAACYVPGGRAAYPSTVAMTVVPAKVAGVSAVVLLTPPGPDGSLPPAVRYAASRAGADLVVKVGGAHAIAAAAYGTDTVPRADIVVGPGNAYVTEAKRQVFGLVGIDGLAGPSELVVVAGEDADPDVLALDLIAQAEHDPLAATTLVTWNEALSSAVGEALARESAVVARQQIVQQALASTRAVLVDDVEQAVEAANALAPEHLQLWTDEVEALLPRIRHAGAVFFGRWNAVPFGDYGVGSNHVLPTMGTARFSAGLRAADFVKVFPVTWMDRDAARALGPAAAALARSEGLDGHARAMEARAEADG